MVVGQPGQNSPPAPDRVAVAFHEDTESVRSLYPRTVVNTAQDRKRKRNHARHKRVQYTEDTANGVHMDPVPLPAAMARNPASEHVQPLHQLTVDENAITWVMRKKK